MATVNKDFKVKNGLVVEGTNATVNGNQVLTENASDQYIIDLIGGETLVTSVDSDQLQVIGGELSVKSGVFDADGAADAAETAANSYTDGRETAITSAYQTYADTAADNAETAANTYTDGRETAITTAYQSYADTAEQDAKNYADGLAVNYDAAGAAATAEQNAKDYADDLINDASSSSTEVWSAYKTSTEIGLAQSAAEDYADTAIANLVDSAPSTLDTLNELAAALQDNPDIITDLQDIAAGKQDTLTAGANIDITGATISVTGLASTDISDFNTAALSATSSAYDAAGSAQTAEDNAIQYAIGLAGNYDSAGSASIAESNANSYTDTAIDGLDTDDIEEGSTNLYFTDGRAKTSAAELLTGATLTNITITGNGSGLTITAENGVADSTTDDLVEGENNLYFTESRAVSAINNADITPNTVTIDTYRKEEATQQYVSSASTVTVHTLPDMYESAKYLVRVVGNVGGVKHSQLTEILLTVDGNYNIAITEYGTICTNTTNLASFSADMAAGSAYLTATTAVSGCEIIAAATMLSWAD
jgi:hypothetical protein